MAKRKFVQIVITPQRLTYPGDRGYPGDETSGQPVTDAPSEIYALADDGTLWVAPVGEENWEYVGEAPQDDDPGPSR